MATFSSILSTVQAAAAAIRKSTSAQRKLETNLRQFCVERNLSITVYLSVQRCLKAKPPGQDRLLESELAFLQEIPDKIRSAMHVEMHAAAISTATWMPSTMTSLAFHERVCHEATTESFTEARHAVFPQHKSCNTIRQLSKGAAELGCTNRRTGRVDDCKVSEGLWLSEAALWVDWRHRGCLSTITSCYFLDIDCQKVIQVAQESPYEYRYLRIFGILLIAHLEDTSRQQQQVSDMPMPKEIVDGLIDRAKGFMKIGLRNSVALQPL
eukprot:TRINITY_DN11281_c0_g1_i5.p1 TRINITY_DN11281_c0_g1~~TRINITY_DN11281_c0_g1_i5.p1  ORF type:complete len:311 (-),score=37.67 TRINITY_DN11281_c0_g1_i5:36-839(-)